MTPREKQIAAEFERRLAKLRWWRPRDWKWVRAYRKDLKWLKS